MANIIDKAIGFFNPEAGLKRARSRMAMQALERAYEGGKRGRLNASWKTHATSADAEIGAAGGLLRDRMRDLVRNNPHAANGVSQLVTHMVGDGIVPRANTGNSDENKRINDLFDEWAEKADADGLTNYWGIQKLAVRGMIESGDGLVRRRRRLPKDNLPVPLQLEVIETDLLDTSKEGPLPGGGFGIGGIEFDAIRKRTAYWLYLAHPGNNFLDPRSALQSRAVPAEDITHVFERQRTQVKGVPWGVSVIRDLRDLSAYEQAEMVRKRMESALVGVLLNSTDNDNLGLDLSGANPGAESDLPGVYDGSGYLVEKFEPGMFAFAKGANDIKFNQPASTQSFPDYKRVTAHTIAAGFRLPYALLTGDLTQVNYSSTKVGFEPFKRLISSIQWHELIPMLCNPHWAWFCEAAFIAGKIDKLIVPVKWTPPHFYSADPTRDTAAMIAEVRAGIRSQPDAIIASGRDPDQVIEEIEEWNMKLDKSKSSIVLDSDPRKVSKQGMFQMEPAPAEPPAPPSGK